VPILSANIDSVERGKELGSGLLYEQKREFQHGLHYFDRICRIGSTELIYFI
jgi:hypothetical protein